MPLVSLHQFRHSCASDLLEAGVHLAEVQRILGHQGIATTVRYTHIADPQRRAAMACIRSITGSMRAAAMGRSWPHEHARSVYRRVLELPDARSAQGPAHRNRMCAARSSARSDAFEERRPGGAALEARVRGLSWWIESEREAGSSIACIAKYLSHVRGLLEYAWRSGRTERNVLDGFQLQDAPSRRMPNFLTLDEAEKLVRGCARASAAARRDRLMILLLYGCGLRTMELCGLDVADISRERQELTVRHGKGDRPRVIPIPEGLYTELLAYLLEHGRRGALFRTAQRAGVSARKMFAWWSAPAVARQDCHRA